MLVQTCDSLKRRITEIVTNLSKFRLSLHRTEGLCVGKIRTNWLGMI